MPTMVRKLSALAIVVLYVSALSTAALAGPPTMNLSSWEPVDTPCECSVTQSAASNGRVQDDVWLIGELAPDTTATLTLSYATPPSGAIGTPGNHVPISRGAELAAVGLFATAVVVIGYRRRLTSAIA